MIAPNGIAPAVPEHVTQTLAWIEQQIAEMKAARATFMRAFNIPEPDQGNGPGPGLMDPATPRPRQPERKDAHPGVKQRVGNKSLLAMAREIQRNGPLTPAQIVAATDLSRATVSNALASSNWFEKLPGNNRSPWQLTDAGRDAMAGESAST